MHSTETAHSNIPLGPYDELMLLPGPFTVPRHPTTPPHTPASALRITRIYVSQRTTTYNGRLNWNIPKHLARFTFSAPPTPQGTAPPASLTVRVYPPHTTENDGTPPFFAAKLTPFTYLPALPVSTSYLPFIPTTIVQPPVPAAPSHAAAAAAAIEAETAPHGPDTYDTRADETALLAGTSQWAAFSIAAQIARARGCWVEVEQRATELEVREAARWFPQGLGAWSVGAWCEGGELGIPVPEVWEGRGGM